MNKLFFFLLLLTSVYANAYTQQRVTVTPAAPQRGDSITITYNPQAPGAGIPAGVSGITLVFSTSNFYNVPYKIPLQRQGNMWSASFRLAGYATYASFYLESGGYSDKPAKDSHYEVMVFDGKKPVKDALLYKGGSMSAQMGKSPELAAAQVSLYQQELAAWPDNYEAKVRLLSVKMRTAANEKYKEAFRQQAHQVIADKFYSDPVNSGNMNKVTMGYLIIGEPTRLDSIRSIVAQKYPDSDLGMQLVADRIAREKDTATQVRTFEAMLAKDSTHRSGAFLELHQRLFSIYAAQKDSTKALYHARYIAAEKGNPRIATTWKSLAQTMLDNNFSLDTARYYAQMALTNAEKFPVGVIRYFPETGHIIPYADDSTRNAVYSTARGNMLSIIGLIDLQQGHKTKAAQHIKQALAQSGDKETMDNATLFYTNTHDTAKLKELQLLREQRMLAKITQQRINRPTPAMNSFVDMKGKPLPPASLKNKIVVIDFWATWCGPCMQEMPYLQKLYDRYKNNPSIVFMIANSGARNTLADAQGWYGNRKYSFPVYYNTDPNIGDKFKFNIIPATYVIAKTGNIQFSNIGFEGEEVETKLRMQIEMLLAQD